MQVVPYPIELVWADQQFNTVAVVMSNRLNTDDDWSNLGGSGEWNRSISVWRNRGDCGYWNSQEIPSRLSQGPNSGAYPAGFERAGQETENRIKSSGCNGAGGGNRTHGLGIMRPSLYHGATPAKRDSS